MALLNSEIWLCSTGGKGTSLLFGILGSLIFPHASPTSAADMGSVHGGNVGDMSC